MRKTLVYGLSALLLLGACRKETHTLDAVVTDTAATASAQAGAPLSDAATGKNIRTERPPANNLQNRSEQGRLTVYFRTNDWKLDANDRHDINAFAKANRHAESWVIEGHCDERGSTKDNKQLGINRAKGIAHYARAYGIPRSRIQIVSYGETQPAVQGSNLDIYRLNRRGILIPSGEVITEGLRRLPADVYLIDGSDSMKALAERGQSRWGIVSKYPFERKSKLYVFDSCEGVRVVNRISDAHPQCSTPLWASVADVVSEMRRGSRLTLLTDGEDTQNGSVYAAAAAAKRRGVIVNVIGVGATPELETQLRYIARETGGTPYINPQY
jgi:peptidoglycan-associated lipoprotein